MLTPDLDLARRFIADHHPAGEVLLCGVTGAHHYGFPSADSDIDLKGIHIYTIPTAILNIQDIHGKQIGLTFKVRTLHESQSTRIVKDSCDISNPRNFDTTL